MESIITNFTYEETAYVTNVIRQLGISVRGKVRMPVFLITLGRPPLSGHEVQKQSRQVSFPMSLIPLDFLSELVTA